MTSKDDPDLEARALRLLDDALDQPEATRLAWVEDHVAGDDALKSRLLALMAQAGEDLSITGGAAGALMDSVDLPMPERIGQYKIERLIGKGGMGAVYLGRRDAGDFDHEVAIKVIRGLRNIPKLEERLKGERQTLAKLNHPNIAQLFDGGETEEGDPYFIMEYVAGSPLRELSDVDMPAERAISIVCQIAEAVQYAHQQLVVHRDLSPSNILVTDEDRAILIDFGISQSISGLSDAAATQYTMTKGYAAPERKAGEPATVFGDIYSLGVILKELLADQKLTRPADIQAILNKATAQDPAGRYDDMRRFADDLRRYTDGGAVDAVGGGPGYRAKRFIGRHPLAVAASGLAVVGLVAATAVMSNLYLRAQAAETEAQQRFEEVRDLASTLMTDILPEVNRVSGAQTARRMIAEASQEYLVDLANAPRATPDLKFDLAEGYISLGRILGSPTRSAFGDPEAGEEMLLAGIAELESLIETDGLSKERSKLLGQAHFYHGGIRQNPHGDLDGMLAALDRSEAVLKEGLAAFPGDKDLQLALLYSEGARATPLFRKGDAEGAEDVNRKSIEKSIGLSAELSDNPEFFRFMSTQRRGLAEILTLTSRFEEAVSVLDQATVDLDQFDALRGEDAYTRRDRSIAHWRKAFALYNLQRYNEALTDYDRAIELTEMRRRLDPSDTDAESLFYSFDGERARVYSALGRYGEAEAALMRGLGWYEEKLAKTPEQAAALRAVAIQHYQIADHHKNAGDDEKRCEQARKMIDYFARLKELGLLSGQDEAALPAVAAEHPMCGLPTSF